MIKPLTLSIVIVLLVTPLSARQSQAPKETANWDAFRFLIGEWEGEGNGAPGEATGGGRPASARHGIRAAWWRTKYASLLEQYHNPQLSRQQADSMLRSMWLFPPPE